MEKIEDGGPAFPCDQIVARDAHGKLFGHEISTSGMSIRDVFAMMAMHTELMTCGVPGPVLDTLLDAAQGADPIEHMARNAYDVADAMLRVRKATS